MQSFVVSKKMLSVHSEDRDITKWPTSTVFDIEIPVEYKNVVSLRLSDIELPASYYVFTAKNQNVTLTATVEGITKVVTITEGTYSPVQLSYELMNQLNNTFPLHTGFQVYYSSTTMKFSFLHPTVVIILHFNVPGSTMYDQYTQWGLGSYLGFCKQEYVSTKTDYHSYGDGISVQNVNVITAPFTASVFGDSYMYMELDYYNSMDEISPYTERSSNMFNARQNGNHNASFAKIPTLAIANQKQYVSKETFLSNIFFSDPPLERIQKLKFKFRYHDGRPVDFGNTNFSFTIEVTMLRPDTIKPSIQVNANHYRLR
jgi:hypothetical protein